MISIRGLIFRISITSLLLRSDNPLTRPQLVRRMSQAALVLFDVSINGTQDDFSLRDTLRVWRRGAAPSPEPKLDRAVRLVMAQAREGGDTMTKNVVRQIRKAARRRFSAKEKIRIVLEELGGEIPVTSFCRREGIQPSIGYKSSKALLDAGKNDLIRDTQRVACYESLGRRRGQLSSQVKR